MLEDRFDYVVAFSDEPDALTRRHFLELGGEFISPQTGILNFGNFIGRASITDVEIKVSSTKVGEEGASRLLSEISELASDLVFGWRAPTSQHVATDRTHKSPIPYHQLQFLRRKMLQERAGDRLQDWLFGVLRNPTRRFNRERPLVGIQKVRRIDGRAIAGVFSNLDRLVPLSTAVAVSGSPLALALEFGNPPNRHMPIALRAPRGVLSYDTIENRFVKHVVEECLSIAYRFVDSPRIHKEMRSDCQLMVGMLEEVAQSPVLADAGRLTSFASPSQALAKSDGYREIFRFWGDITSHVSLPLSPEEVSRFLEGRDMAQLYEYWVYLKILEGISNLLGKRPDQPPLLKRDEFGESLVLGFSTSIGSLRLGFNQTFTRTGGAAYSTPLRPDVTMEVDKRVFVFDAKYKLNKIDTSEDDCDDGVSVYKRDDLYKMHTYRDAIKDAVASFIVYPGTAFVFYGRSGQKCESVEDFTPGDGVGAVPLRPSSPDSAFSLRAVLAALLSDLGMEGHSCP